MSGAVCTPVRVVPGNNPPSTFHVFMALAEGHQWRLLQARSGLERLGCRGMPGDCLAYFVLTYTLAAKWWPAAAGRSDGPFGSLTDARR